MMYSTQNMAGKTVCVYPFQSTEPPSHKAYYKEFYKRKRAVKIFLHPIQGKSRLQFCPHDYQAGAWNQTISSHCSYAGIPYIPTNIPNYNSYAHPLIQKEYHIPGLAVWKLLRWLNGSVRFFSHFVRMYFSSSTKHRLEAWCTDTPCTAGGSSKLDRKYYWTSKVSDMETHFLTSHKFLPLLEELVREPCTPNSQFHK